MCVRVCVCVLVRVCVIEREKKYRVCVYALVRIDGTEISNFYNVKKIFILFTRDVKPDITFQN